MRKEKKKTKKYQRASPFSKWLKKNRLWPGWLKEETFRFVEFLFIICFFSFWGIFMWWKLSDEEKVEQLERPSFGLGSHQEELIVRWEEKEKQHEESITVQILEQELSKKQIFDFFARTKKQLESIVLGENVSVNHVEYDLNLPERLEDNPVTISWISSNPSIVNWEGKLGEKIPKEGTLVSLEGQLMLQGEEETYSFVVNVYPAKHTTQETIEQIVREESENREGSVIMLPKSNDNIALSWIRKRNKFPWGIVMLLFFCPVLILLRERELDHERKKLEEKQLLLDYPNIVNKLALLLGAGVNLRRAMEHIAKDYVRHMQKKNRRKAYETILEICQEMERGISEKEAYERLGERCSIMQYRTLSAILVQHLQKGGDNMEHILEEEAWKSQEGRRKQARMLGEQASTKLLFPMVLMLLVVFVIVMVPAWTAFSI